MVPSSPSAKRGEHEPHQPGVGRGELAPLEQRPDHHVAGQEVDRHRGRHVERDALEPACEPVPDGGPARGAEAGELGQLGGGHGHAEEADGQEVEHLGVGERGHRAHREEAGQDQVDVGQELDDAPAHHDRR